MKCALSKVNRVVKRYLEADIFTGIQGAIHRSITVAQFRVLPELGKEQGAYTEEAGHKKILERIV